MGIGGFRLLPDGMRDLHPDEAFTQRSIEDAMSRVMEIWGYTEVVPSTLRFSGEGETVRDSGGAGPYIDSRTYKFADPRGRIVMLRPEMTVPVAAMAGSEGWPFPAKVYYRGNVFRIEDDRSGRPNEFCQVGAEAFGAAGPWADAEIIALCAACLQAAGVRVFRIGIGNAGATNRLLENAGLEGDACREALEALQRRDMVSFDSVVMRAGAGRDVLVGLRESLRPVPASAAGDAFPGWRDILEGLRVYDIERYACVDLSIVRDMSYYTGMVFEVYGKGIGRALGGGGRYDGLMSRFGSPQPATGFALSIPEVSAVLRAQGTEARQQPVTLAVGAPGSVEQAVRLGISLRSKGVRVRVEGDPCTREEASVRGARIGAGTVLYVSSRGCEEIPAGGTAQSVSWVGWLASSASPSGIH